MSALTEKDAYQLLHDGSLVFARMEHNGIRIDTERLKASIDKAGKELLSLQNELREDDLYEKWRRRFGQKSNLGSRQQLGVVLYDVLGLECKTTTEKGNRKVDQTALEEMDLPFVKKFLRVEKLKKLKSTYLEGVLSEVCDGFLHPSFNLHTVVTFRSSSSQPNFHNLPIRNPELGRIIRSCFVPRKGRRLVEIDYSGVEVRVAACYHKDPTMLKYIKDPKRDMHRDTAAEIYMVPTERVSKEMRHAAKNKFVFPAFYGSVYFQCAKDLWSAIGEMNLKYEGVSLKEHLASKGITSLGACDPKQEPRDGTFEKHLKEVERLFWEVRFPQYTQWKKDWYNQYLETGEMRSLTGFRMQGIYKRNEVLNYVVQAAAFHCLLWSSIRIQKWLDRDGLRTKLVGQIHDCILADVPEDEIQVFLKGCKRIMTQRLLDAWKWIITPMEVEVDVTPEGGSWADKEPWHEENGLWVKKPKK